MPSGHWSGLKMFAATPFIARILRRLSRDGRLSSEDFEALRRELILYLAVYKNTILQIGILVLLSLAWQRIPNVVTFSLVRWRS